jgi:hypothetical protein
MVISFGFIAVVLVYGFVFPVTIGNNDAREVVFTGTMAWNRSKKIIFMF